MELGLNGRVALVTAASKGLGRGAAEALASEGANVVVSARSEAALETLAEELRGFGVESLALVGDLADPETPSRLVSETIDRFGRIDVLVANNGGPPPGRAFEVSDEALLAAIQANFLTSVRLVRAAAPIMTEAGWGRICCIASSSVIQPIPTLASSNTSRTALRAWVRTAAADLADAGVTLNLACPGLHRTDRMLELSARDVRMGDPADFGRVVAFLCSEPAGFVNGASVVVDGGAMLAL